MAASADINPDGGSDLPVPPFNPPRKVQILLDTIGPCHTRLTTIVCRYERFIHAELLTHRVFSRSSSSSRAIPVQRLLADVRREPVVPSIWFGNQRGMMAAAPLDDAASAQARSVWLKAMENAVSSAEALSDLGVSKGLANRLTEPFAFISTIITATDWSNFVALRCAPDAQPELRSLALAIRAALDASTPVPVARGAWHLPWITAEDRIQICSTLEGNAELAQGVISARRTNYRSTSSYGTCLVVDDNDFALGMISAARCARISYNTHAGVRSVEEDLKLAQRLAADGHMSPFEHQARAGDSAMFNGNLSGCWEQLRKTMPNESR